MAPKQPDPGPDDCYNRVTSTCNKKHPGKDWGDKVYRDCITDGLDWCDINEPSRTVVVPGFDSRGRLAVQTRFEKAITQLFR
jgi:hypothetical protein